MTRDFLKPQKTTGLDTNAPIAKQSPFASRPFARIPRPEMSPQDIQTMRERAARIEQLGNPMIKAWANTQPTVQQQAMPEEEKEENLQTKQESTVQRQESEEEETLQTKSEPSLQREELPEEEDETLQMQSEPDVQLKCQDCEQEQAEVQTKLTIGQPGDKYEQEADNMAAQVMSMPDPTAENLQRQETEEETLQQKPLTDSITPVVQRQTSETPQQDSTSQSLESQLAAEKGSGSLLSDEVRGFMEPRFGADFSEVRVHTGTAAVQMNKELGAQAFTHGNDIYYGKGKAPRNDALTAHELTHVVQQNNQKVMPWVQRQPRSQSHSSKFSIFKVLVGHLNVRKSPSRSAPKLGDLPLGKRVRAKTITNNQWLELDKFKDKKGNTHSKAFIYKGEGGWVEHQISPEPCPTTLPNPIPPGWKLYNGDPKWFHCDYKTILEDKSPTVNNPQNECVYDHFGQLVDKNHIFSNCRGTPDQYDSDEEPIKHTFWDQGGIWHQGGPAFKESWKHDIRFIDYYSLEELRRLSTSRKIKLIENLLEYGVNYKEIDAIEKLCSSVSSDKEAEKIKQTIEPQIVKLTIPIGKRTRLRLILGKM